MSMTITAAKQIGYRTGIKERRLTYAVSFNGNFDPAYLEAGSYESLPALGDASGSFICTDINTAFDGLGSANVEYVYTLPDLTNNGINLTITPLDRPATIRFENADIEEPMVYDYNDVLVANSRGELYQDPLTTPVQALRIVISRNVESNPNANILSHNHRSNSDTWYSCDPETVYIESYTAEKQYETFEGDAVTYWTETLALVVKASTTWRVKLLDKGTELDPATNMSEPCLLDGAGNVTDTPTYYPETGFARLDTAAFSALNLPNPFA